jgi:hypothetical protein
MAFRIAYWIQDERWFIPPESDNQYLYFNMRELDSRVFYDLQKWANEEAVDDIIACYGQEIPLYGDRHRDWGQMITPSKTTRVVALDKRDLMTMKLKFKQKGIYQ